MTLTVVLGPLSLWWWGFDTPSGTGRKRFDLFSPADAENMYVVGPLSYVHSNGRINYAPEPTSADGRGIGADAAAELEVELKEAEAEVRASLRPWRSRLLRVVWV